MKIHFTVLYANVLKIIVALYFFLGNFIISVADPRLTKSTRLCNSCLSLFENFVLFGRNQNNREKELSRDPAETVMSSDH